MRKSQMRCKLGIYFSIQNMITWSFIPNILFPSTGGMCCTHRSQGVWKLDFWDTTGVLMLTSRHLGECKIFLIIFKTHFINSHIQYTKIFSETFMKLHNKTHNNHTNHTAHHSKTHTKIIRKFKKRRIKNRNKRRRTKNRPNPPHSRWLAVTQFEPIYARFILNHLHS